MANSPYAAERRMNGRAKEPHNEEDPEKHQAAQAGLRVQQAVGERHGESGVVQQVGPVCTSAKKNITLPTAL